MKMRYIAVVVWGLGLSLWVGSALGAGAIEAGAAAPSAVEQQSRFIHTVLFWLKPGTTDARKAQLIADCKELLGAIQTVRYLAAGEPAGTPRQVVDNSYQVGLVVHFEDSAGHDVYQAAELHQQFIERNQDIWERVQVYDLVSR